MMLSAFRFQISQPLILHLSVLGFDFCLNAPNITERKFKTINQNPRETDKSQVHERHGLPHLVIRPKTSNYRKL